MISKWLYYGRSVFTLLVQFYDPLKIIRIFINKAQFPIEVAVRHPALRFFVASAMDVWVIKESVVDGDYLPTGFAVQPDWQVLDIGASLGDFAVLAAKMAKNGTVHAYEPLGRAYHLLEKNRDLNHSRNLTLYAEAVAAQSGRCAIVGDSRVAVSTRFASAEKGVPVVSLKTALERLPGGRCDLLKIDCEGGEYDILLGSAETTLQKIDRITLEYHDGFTDYTHLDLIRRLQSLGFTVRRRPNPVHPHLGLIFAQQHN